MPPVVIFTAFNLLSLILTDKMFSENILVKKKKKNPAG